MITIMEASWEMLSWYMGERLVSDVENFMLIYKNFILCQGYGPPAEVTR